MKCPDCPIDPGRPCVAEWTRHAAYCRWAKAGGARRDRVVELSSDPPPVRIDGATAPPSLSVDYSIPERPPSKCCG